MHRKASVALGLVCARLHYAWCKESCGGRVGHLGNSARIEASPLGQSGRQGNKAVPVQPAWFFCATQSCQALRTPPDTPPKPHIHTRTGAVAYSPVLSTLNHCHVLFQF